MCEKYQVKARQIDREIERKWNKNKRKGTIIRFETGLGKINVLVGFTKNKVLVKSEDGESINEISRENFRKSISYTLFKRTVTRKELESFSNFNTALMALLKEVFNKISRYIKDKTTRLIRLTLKGVRHYFSGLEASPAEMKRVHEQGGSFVLLNFFHLKRYGSNNWYESLCMYDLYAYIDSGAFSLHQAKCMKKSDQSKYANPSNLSRIKEDENTFFVDMMFDGCCDWLEVGSRKEISISVEEYAAFINHYKKDGRILGFFNLDVIGDQEASDENYARLLELTGLKPIPVWHPASGFDALQSMVDRGEFEVIGIGGTVVQDSPWRRIEKQRVLFDELFERFPDQNWHWLGGGNELILEYPFFSTDSTKYLSPRKFGEEVVFTIHGFTPIPETWTMSDVLDFGIYQYIQLEELYYLEEKKQLNFGSWMPNFFTQSSIGQMSFF